MSALNFSAAPSISAAPVSSCPDCGFQLNNEEPACTVCTHAAALEIYHRVSQGESVSVLFTGVAASPVLIGGKWFWTLNKIFGDSEFEYAQIAIRTEARTLPELLNLEGYDVPELLARLDRFRQGISEEGEEIPRCS